MRQTKTLLVLIALLFPIASHGQFIGGDDVPSTPPWKQFNLNPRTRIKLDFRNSGVDNIVAFFSKTAGITIVKDPSLTGQLNVTSAKEVTMGEAFQIFSTVLGLKGYEFSKDGNLLVIRKRTERPQGRDGGGQWGSMSPEMIGQFMSGSQTQLRVYEIKHANASQVARVINEVFATVQNPMDQLMQMMGQRGNQNNNQRFNQNRFNRGNFGRMGQPTAGQVVRASSDDFSNSVIVNAPSKEQDQVSALIRQIDKETEEPQKPRVFPLEFASAEEMAPVVQNVLVSNAPRGRGGIGTQNVPIEQRFQQAMRFGNAQASFGTVVADVRTNSLVVTATEANLQLVAQVIEELDKEVKFEASTFVVPLDNARADQISQLLNQAFGTRTTGGMQNRNTQNTQNRNNQNRNNQNRNRNQGLGGGMGGGRQAEDGKSLELFLENEEGESGDLMTNISVAQGGGFGQVFGGQRPPTRQVPGQTTGRDAQGRLVNVRDLSGQVTTIADPNTNSIIVVATPENAELIRQILAQLDRIPEQVMIETLIVEATLDASTKLGVEWSFSQDRAFGTSATGSGTTGFGLQNANPALQGLRYTLTGQNFSVFLNALKTDQRFQVLSTPRIFTSNNAEAQINISQSIPYVLSQREDPNGNLTFNYAFQDVGIVLTVTPRITANGYVTMEVTQTANDLQGFTSFNAPIVNQRQADTTVSVKDGETIILGGIIRNTVSSTTRKIPLLGDIPILGQLFRSTDRSNVKTELLVFLTPHIVRDPAEASRLRQDQQNKLSKGTQKTIEDALKKDPPKKDPPKAEPPKQDPPKQGGNGG